MASSLLRMWCTAAIPCASCVLRLAISKNETVYPVTVDENGDVIEISVVNDLIPEIGTTAAIDDEKEVCATEVFTLTDTVEYKHLVPGKEYTARASLWIRRPANRSSERRADHFRGDLCSRSSTPAVWRCCSPSIPSNSQDGYEHRLFESLYSDSKELTVHTRISRTVT